MLRTPQASFSRNRLLSIMDAADFENLRPHLERVPLGIRDTFEAPGEPIRHVYFPEPCVVSVVASTEAGEKIEVGIFGPDGMSGLAILHGSDRSPLHTYVQVPGAGIRIEADRIRDAIGSSPTLRRTLGLFAQAFTIQVSYTALANGRCTIEQRLARWLLMCHDRLDGNVVALTHEFLALMLGVRRAGVTGALQVLEAAKAIRVARGRIEIADRDGLLQGAAGSYGPAETEYERLIAG